MKRCNRGQVDQGEVLDNCCHVTSALRTLRFEGHVIISHNICIRLIYS